MRYIKKTSLVRAERVPIEDNNKSSMFQHGKILGLFMSIGFQKFKVTHEKGYEIYLGNALLNARPGDWIVIDSDDSVKVYTHGSFSQNFEPG